MKCILCLEDKSLTEEHIFPDAIGGTLTANFLCKSCNDRLGHSIDIHLIDHWTIQAIRMAKGIVGKSGEIPNIFENGTLVDHPNIRVRYEFNGGKPQRIYVVTKKETTDNGDGTQEVSFVVDATDRDRLPQMINKTLRRNNLPELTDDQIQTLLNEVSNPTPNVSYKFVFDQIKYKKGIIKIAYELACLWLGEPYVQGDHTAELFRKCLDQPADDLSVPIIGNIGLVDPVSGVGVTWGFNPDCHVGALIRSGESLSCYVRVFNAFEGIIQVSDKASAYGDLAWKAVVIDPVSGELNQGQYWDVWKKFNPDM